MSAGAENTTAIEPMEVEDAVQPAKEAEEATGCQDCLRGGCCKGGSALMNTDSVPVWAKWVILASALASCIIFITAHTSVGASVMIQIHVPHQELTTDAFPNGIPEITYQADSVFDFTLANSIKDMWDAKVYPLALLIAVFSGGWPYIKNLLICLAWAAPLKHVDRHRMLRWLDILGKYSMVDVIVLVVMMVAFRMTIETPTLNYLDYIDSLPLWLRILLLKYISDHDIDGDGVIHGIEVDVWVVPGWGIFGFVLAVVISLVATHVVMYYHQSYQRGGARLTGHSDADEMKSLRTHNYKWEHYPTRTRNTLWGQLWMIGTIVFTFLLLNTGANIDSFRMNYGGAAALFIKEPHPEFSLTSLAGSLLETDGLSSSEANGMNLMWVIFIFFCYIIPLLHVVMLFLVYMIPATLRYQWGFLTITSVLHAWGTLEVFVISLIVSVLETPQFVEFIIGDHCDLINEFLELAHDNFPDLYPYEPVCVDISTELLAGCYTLIFCMLWYICVANMLQSLIEDVTHDRLQLDDSVPNHEHEHDTKFEELFKEGERKCLFNCMCIEDAEESDARATTGDAAEAGASETTKINSNVDVV